MQMNNELCSVNQGFTFASKPSSISQRFATANTMQVVSTFAVAYSIRASTAVVSLILPVMWTASMFALVNPTKVSTAAHSHVFLEL